MSICPYTSEDKKSPYHGDPRPRPEIRGQGRGGDEYTQFFGDGDGGGAASNKMFRDGESPNIRENPRMPNSIGFY